ncbi:HET-domain-containing protein [Sporormia fimetaria CBS 119925]|uniref:HET-domain-containing protein n=1 Tax=Sporormia fimetaria CBS 119925 TaxID=1340428 RepID=A0A6A6V7I1_9PLEO|nr:HET-domain-containing protein [Sporormia fimetaria CBS 119925]
MEPYIYQPLENPDQDIRLLELIPGDFDAPLEIRIVHAPLIAKPPPTPPGRLPLGSIQRTVPSGYLAYETLEGRVFFYDEKSHETSWNHPDDAVMPASYCPMEPRSTATVYFEALSYVWGDNTAKTELRVSSEDEELRSLCVGQNLAMALLYLRAKNYKRTLWIDAICINQSDHAEKRKQVSRMAELYALAPKTILWLGAEADDSALALGTMEAFGKLWMISLQEELLHIRPGHDWGEVNRELEKMLLPKCRRALDAVAQRPYFQRLWIRQEVGLSRHRAVVQCGRYVLSWPDLQAGVRILNYKTDDSLADSLLQDLSQTMMEVTPISELLYNTRHCKCYDPRDRIYAILGLLPDSVRSQIPPDYTLSTVEVYRLAFLADNRLLNYCDLKSRRLDGPSWVADLSSEPSMLLPIAVYSATADIPSPRYQVDSHILRVSGVMYTQVETVSRGRLPLKHSADAQFQLLHLFRSFFETLETATDVNGPSLDAILINVLTQGYYSIDQIGGSERHDPRVAQWRKALKHMLEGIKGDMESFCGREEVHAPDGFLRYLCSHSGGLALIQTRNKLIGIGSPGAEPGDQVCLVFGYELPLLLRPQENGTFKVVGTAYIHGLGDGEALLGELPHPWRALTIIQHRSSRRIFHNLETSDSTRLDPRLPPLKEPWRRMMFDKVPSPFPDPSTGEIVTIPYYYFEHQQTGEISGLHTALQSDDFIRSRGVEVRDFDLV